MIASDLLRSRGHGFNTRPGTTA